GVPTQLREQQKEDVVPDIRAACMEELGVWMRGFPASFLSDGHLKYLGWNLHDKPLVRLRCVRSLRALYALPDTAAQMELFTGRFKVRRGPTAPQPQPHNHSPITTAP
uniref:SCD domain-containing protein n=1 Tax=Phasianus colchicus TaxID=9054 RepID=A0A669QZ35_PHACC